MTRQEAILELSRYSGFPLQEEFAHWLSDSNDAVSRAAAVALVKTRPQPALTVFAKAVQSQNAGARANAAWALGMLGAPADTLRPLLEDKDPHVLQETLMALGRCPGDVPAETLLPLLSHPSPAVRGGAAVALALHQPKAALKAIPAQLKLEMQAAVKLGNDYERRGRPKLTQAEIDEITGYFRCQMKMVQAISMIKSKDTSQILEQIALRPGQDSAQYDSIVATFQMWDLDGIDIQTAIGALGSTDTQLADRTEWMLVKRGSTILPEVRKALASDNPEIRRRSIRIVAWQGDLDSVSTLRSMQTREPEDAVLLTWAIDKIESLHPQS